MKCSLKKHTWRAQLRLGVIMLRTPKLDVSCVSYVHLRVDVQLSCWLNGQANYTVKQRTNSTASEFPFSEDWQRLHIDILLHAYSGNCWEWKTCVYSSLLREHAVHIFILGHPHFFCDELHLSSVGLIVIVTTGYPTCCFPLKAREQRSILLYFVKLQNERVVLLFQMYHDLYCDCCNVLYLKMIYPTEQVKWMATLQILPFLNLMMKITV